MGVFVNNHNCCQKKEEKEGEQRIFRKKEKNEAEWEAS